MRRASCLFSLLISLSVLLPSPAARAGDPPRRAVAGPFTVSRDNGTPLVEVAFSNGKIGLFMIDTGAYDCVMTPACAKRLGYKQDDNALYLRGLIYDGVTLKFPTVQVHDMRIGRLQVSDITFKVAPDEVGSENGRPVDGLLGGPLLSRFALLLDYPRRTLSWIYPGNLDDTTVSELGLDPKSAFGLHQEEHFGLDFKVNHYSTPVQLRAGEQRCMEDIFFDTGAPDSSISAAAAKRLKLISSGREQFDYVFQSPDDAERSIVPTFQIGSEVFSDVSVMYPTHSGSYMVPLIGENVLGGCVVLFDFGPHRCFLQPVLPGMTPGPLPPLNTAKIDWERLRNAPEPLDLPPLVLGLLYPRLLDGLPQEIAQQAALTGNAADAEGYEKLAVLLRQGGDEPGAKRAAEQAVRLRRADADAHPDDPARAALWISALSQSGQSDAALTAAQKSAARWPDSPAVLFAQGLAQEARAVFLLLGRPGQTVTDTQASDLSLSLGAKPAKPSPALAQQIAALRGQARDSARQAIALAPNDPAGYNHRARLWLLDFLLAKLLDSLGAKGQTPSAEAALAAGLADFRSEAGRLPNNPDVLLRVILLDTARPQFHDDGWFQKNLRGTGQVLEARRGAFVTAQTAQAHLTMLSESSDPKTAAPALEALGTLQAAQDDPAAEATLRKSLAQDPTRPGALASVATRLIADNRLSALGDLLLKQSDAAATPASCLLLSETLCAVGQSATAEEEAREALKRLPDSPQANMALARLLLARSGDDPSVLPEASACLTKAEAGLGAFASPTQKASLQMLQAVWQALSGDPVGARTLLLRVLHDRPTCTQAREALYALSVPPAAP